VGRPPIVQAALHLAAQWLADDRLGAFVVHDVRRVDPAPAGPAVALGPVAAVEVGAPVQVGAPVGPGSSGESSSSGAALSSGVARWSSAVTRSGGGVEHWQVELGHGSARVLLVIGAWWSEPELLKCTAVQAKPARRFALLTARQGSPAGVARLPHESLDIRTG
jgi:hypothetical protein